MLVRRTVLAAAVIAVAAGMLPASAADDTTYTQTGVNNGDVGAISLTFQGFSTGRRGDVATGGSNGTVDAKCEFYQATRPSSNTVDIVVEGHAHVVPHGTVRPVSTGVRCVLINAYTNVVLLDDEQATESANAVWTPEVKETTATSVVVCAQATVHWSDNSVTHNPTLACQYPA